MNEKLIVQMDSKKTRICNTKVRKAAARLYLILSILVHFKSASNCIHENLYPLYIGLLRFALETIALSLTSLL